ncbi:MAG TPA: hypothetical protein VN961_02675 [Streptosporangiaceae bacterium]|nr:hypothetical protein [Streptosporangiaceae bacterium]
MCSTAVQRIAEIGQAIDELAAQAGAAEARSGRTSEGQTFEGQTSDSDQVVIRLAELWAQLAELDPDVARRLPTYEA